MSAMRTVVRKARARRRLSRSRARLLLVVAATATLLTAGWLWLRDSSLVRVEQVYITGTTSSEEPAIRKALREAAMDMTTLHVREDQLRTAVEPYRSVAALETDPGFPHKLTIEVIQHRPVAVLQAGDTKVPADAGGLLLRGVKPERVPAVRVKRIPGGGPKTRDPRALAALAVAGAAPPRLLPRGERIWWGGRGLTLDLRDGPALVFGSRADARVKWMAAARVLADPAATGATYLDLRIPERVAAGGKAPVAEEDPDGDVGQPPAGTAAPATTTPAAPLPATPTPAAP
jgi:cell division protein FtsQ